jgi:predicted dinucleotide-binding enzyme
VNIGIIGAGMIGETLARRLVQFGHQIAIANTAMTHIAIQEKLDGKLAAGG